MNSNANPYRIDRSMSFFITSDGSGDGANYGGLEGADANCNALAETAGSSREWAAYLSTSLILDRSSGVLEITNGINARDRIGRGPWYNAEGVLIARNMYHLHRESVNIDIETGLDENGKPH